MKHRIMILTAAIALSVAVSAAIVGAGDDVMFAYTFTEGQANDYTIKFNQEVDAGFFTMNVFADMDVTEKCVGIDGDVFKMEMVFNKVEASMMAFGKTQDAQISDILTGQSVVYTMTKNGKVDDVKAGGYIESWKQISQIIEPILDTGYAYLPATGISQGGTWEPVEEQDPEEELKFELSGEFTFVEVKEEMGRECAFVKGELTTDISGSAQTPGGPARAEGEGKGSYEFFFDPATSLIVRLKGKMDIEMDMVPEAGGDAIETTVGFTVERKLK